MLKNLWKLAVRMHRGEQGAETFERVLVITALALPLVGLAIFYGSEVQQWLSDKWAAMKGDNRVDGGGGY
jgi:hypothetical protein